MAGVRGQRGLILELFDHLVAPGTRCAWVDFPNYTNVGDNAIWLGELDTLRRRRVSVRYMADLRSYNPGFMRELGPYDHVLFQGGGNFGDLWPAFQELRNEVLAGYAGCSIVQFPQSIYFRSVENLRKTADVISSHGNFLLLVRDRRSFDVAREYFDCTVRLCPDMAFGMDPGRIDGFGKTPSVETVYLSRTDKEAAKSGNALYPEDMLVVDWVGRYKVGFSRYYKMVRRLERSKAARSWLPLQMIGLKLAEKIASERLSMGCRMLCQAENVVTDRLHGMILSSLLGLKVYAFDNSYGKLSAYHETWKDWLPGVVFCRDEAEAIDAATS